MATTTEQGGDAARGPGKTEAKKIADLSYTAGVQARSRKSFWDWVDQSGNDDGCWLWLGARNRDGYGVHSGPGSHASRRRFYAHRFAYEDNPPCVNPAHLFLGTVADNNQDRARKGRSSRLRGEKNPRAKLTWEQARLIRESNETCLVLSARFGVSRMIVSRIRRGLAWSVEAPWPTEPPFLPNDSQNLGALPASTEVSQ